MIVEIGAEAALFPEKEYIKGIFIAVRKCASCINARDDKQLMMFGRLTISAAPSL